MTTLSAGRRETVHLPALHGLTVIASADGSGRVTRLGDQPGQPSQGYAAVTASGTTLVGPYSTPTRHEVQCDEGSFTYGDALVDFPTLAESLAWVVNQLPLYAIPRSGTVPLPNYLFEYAGEGPPDVSAQATLSVNPDGDDNALTFTAAAYGESGNGISIEYVDPEVEDSALSVEGTLDDNGFAIVVSLETDSEGAIVSTAAEVKAAIEAAIEGWVTIEIDATDTGSGDDGSGVVTAMAAAFLEGGAGVGVGEAGPGCRYTDLTDGVLYINKGDLEQPVWVALAEVPEE